MNNPMNVVEQMPLPHLLERLRTLAEHRSPAPPTGPAPVILAEWCLLNEAANRLQRAAADLEAAARTAKNTPEDWPYWCVVTDSGKIIFTTADGKRVALLKREDYRMNTERARTWTVHPMFAGGVTTASEVHAESADA